MPDGFVSPEWLASHRQSVVVVDVRHVGEFDRGHIPGAVHIPFERFRDPGDETEGKLPTAADFASLFGQAGIGPEDRIVAYDDDHGVYASRFLVTAEVFGHDVDRLHLLDGDIEAWKREYGTTTEDPTPRQTDYECRRRDDDPPVSAAELEAALEGDAIIVDTRDPVEYDTVHLPGAVNFEWRDLVDEQARRLKPHDTMETVLKDHGITPSRPVRLYCNTARRLSFVYLVLRELGYDDVAFYEGGIDAWASYGGPVETTRPS